MYNNFTLKCKFNPLVKTRIKMSNMSKRISLISTLFIFVSSILFGQATITTTGAGDFNDPTKWNSGVPGTTDTAIVAHAMTMASTNTVADLKINSAASLTTSNTLTISHFCLINTGGVLTNNSTITINGNYQVDGTHAGSGIIILGGSSASNISGNSGDVTNTNKVDIKTSNRTILEGSDIDFNTLTLKLFNGITVTNNGNVNMKRLLGSNTDETWTNGSGSVLVMGQTSGSLLLDASASNNSVSYTNNGGVTTDILQPTTGEYYDLSVLGNGHKRLRGHTTIKNDLTIGGTVEFEANRLGSVSDITIKGDWLNTGGQFVPSTGTVTFSGVDQNLDLGSTNENFYDLDLLGSGTLTQTGEATIANDLTFFSEYDLNGGTTSIAGDFINSGTFTHSDGTIEMNGGSAQSITASTVFGSLTINSGNTVTNDLGGTSEIEGTLSLEAGTFDTNNELIIVSSSTATGRIGEVTGGSISGNVTVQRYFDPVFQGWHQLGVATNSASLTDWNDDFLTTGFTGSNFPTFPFINVVAYDETVTGSKNMGLTGASNITDAVNIGNGRRVYLDNEPMNIETTGTINTGDFIFPVTFTSSGGSTEDGWNLISNPYASAIDWDADGWTKTAINDAVYVWDGDLGLYNSYIAGVSTNGGSNIIPSSQALWIQANNSGTVALTVTESDKSTANGTFKNLSDQVVFNMFIDGPESSDELALVIRDGSTQEFDPLYDAHKFYPDNGFASIASLSSDSVELSINTFPSFDSDMEIPIHVFSDPGTYDLRADDNAELPGTVCSTIEDLFTEEIYPFNPGQNISFDWSGASMISPRFIIYFSAPAAVLNILETSCPGASDAIAEITGNGSGPWDYLWYDIDGTLLQESLENFNSDELGPLVPGEYSVEIIGSNTCGNDVIEFEVTDAITTELNVLNTEIDPCSDPGIGKIEFELQNSTEGSIWDLELKNSSDETIYQSSEPAGTIEISGLMGDIYTLSAINDCDNLELEVDITDPNEVISNFVVLDQEINLFSGQGLETINNSDNASINFWDLGDGAISYEEDVIHFYEEVGTYLVILTASNGDCSDQSQTEIEVIDQITSLDEFMDTDFNIFVNDNQEIVISSENIFEEGLLIELSNLAGQKLYSHTINSFSGYEVITNLDMARSVYFVSVFDHHKRLISKKINY